MSPVVVTTQPPTASGSVNDCSTNLVTFSNTYSYNFRVSGDTLIYEGGNPAFNGTIDLNAGTWSFDSNNARSSTLCKDGSNSFYNWNHSGTVDGSGSGTFQRFCNGNEVTSATATNSSSLNGDTLTVDFSTNGTRCEDLFEYN